MLGVTHGLPKAAVQLQGIACWYGHHVRLGTDYAVVSFWLQRQM